MNLAHHRPTRIGPKLAIGVILILGGLALALQNLGYLQHFDFWELFGPAAMLVLGLSIVVPRPFHLGGHALLFFGTAFLLGGLGYGHIPDRWWPLGLVWAGVVVTLRALRGPKPSTCQDASRGSHE